jgi:ATP-dependent Lhr-like helicase
VAGDLLLRFPPQALLQALERDLPRTPLFAARFREVAGRALLLERAGPGRRAPLWLQRLRAADLLAAVGRHPDFALLGETRRECLEEAFDVPAWREAMEAVADRRWAVVVRERSGPSPMAAELEFRFKAAALYRPDAPRAEVGAADLAGPEAGAPEAVAGEYLSRAEAAVRRHAGRPARSADELHDRLLRAGALLPEEVAPPERPLLQALRAAGRVVDRAGRLLAAEDAAAWDAAAAGDPVARASLVRRLAGAVPSVSAAEVAARFGWSPDLEGMGLVPLGGGRYGDAEVRRAVRRRALAMARAEVAPVGRDAFAAFVWGRQTGGDAAACLRRLQGCFLPPELWLRSVLPSRVPGFRTADLERLLGRGAFLWVGRGDAVAFYAREDHPALGGGPEPAAAADLLPPGAALWFSDLLGRVGGDAETLAAALRELVRRGAASNDALEPLLPDRPWAAVGGRWWAVPPARPTAAAWAEQLLARYGVVSRELWALAAAPVPWSEGARALEATGALRGHFVRGLGGLQFARAADVDALRAGSGEPPTRVLPGADPACIWREADRRARTFLVVQGGRPALLCAATGRRCRPLRPLDPAALQAVAAALRDLPGPRGRVEVAEWDGRPVLDAPAEVLEALGAAGFRRGPATLRWRAPGT